MTSTYQLADNYGRVATDLRVSLTDRCNLRCQYCMPPEGLEWMPHSEALSDDEINRLVRIGIELLGIESVRFTGGEPLLRRGLAGIISATKAVNPAIETSLTTNGLGLKHTAKSLAEAGLDRLNVSLDSLEPRVYEQITLRDRHHDVIDGLEAARDAGMDPIKINAVLLRGINDHEAPSLVHWAMAEGYHLRFIEQMPLDAQHKWSRDTFFKADETLALLSEHFTLTARDDRGSAPAERFTIDGGPHTVGIIGSITRPFCADCNRVRLTADGQVRNCLFARDESDLRTALRNGSSDDEIAQQWVAAMRTKRAGHGVDDETFLQPTRPMSAIGG